MRHLGPVETARFSPDGRRVLTPVATPRRVSWTRRRVNGSPQCGTETGFSMRASVLTEAACHGIRRWYGTGLEYDRRFSSAPSLNHTGMVYWAEFSADGRRVVTASADRTARVWDATSGELKRELRGHGSHVIVARFTPTGHASSPAARMGQFAFGALSPLRCFFAWRIAAALSPRSPSARMGDVSQ
jgi:WD40 repeat protein